MQTAEEKKIVIPKELDKQIRQFIESNQPEFYWDYDDKLSDEQIMEILDNPDEGYSSLYSDIMEFNFEYELELIDDAIKSVFEYFKDELIEVVQEHEEEEETETYLEETAKTVFDEEYRDLIFVDYNIQGLINNTGDLTGLIIVYSNFDCCNSFDDPDDTSKETYLSQVFQRVKAGVKKEGFKNEFYNGAYGGSLFCFAFNTDIENLIELKKSMKEGKQIKIPKGTQYGFHSSFQGSSSMFENETYRNMTLNIKENGEEYHPDYDDVGIIADIEQSYSVADVCGDTDWIKEQNIEVIK